MNKCPTGSAIAIMANRLVDEVASICSGQIQRYDDENIDRCHKPISMLSILMEEAHGLANLLDREHLDKFLSLGMVSASLYIWPNIGRRDEFRESGLFAASSPFDATGIRVAYYDADQWCGHLTSPFDGYFPITVALGNTRTFSNVGYAATKCEGSAVRVRQFFLREEFMGLRVEHRCLNILKNMCRKAHKQLVDMEYIPTGKNEAVGYLKNEAINMGFFNDGNGANLPSLVKDGSTFLIHTYEWRDMGFIPKPFSDEI